MLYAIATIEATNAIGLAHTIPEIKELVPISDSNSLSPFFNANIDEAIHREPPKSSRAFI